MGKTMTCEKNCRRTITGQQQEETRRGQIIEEKKHKRQGWWKIGQGKDYKKKIINVEDRPHQVGLQLAHR
jgi:hypothetical protein